MDREKLQEAKDALGIAPVDRKSFRWRRFREKWIIPVTGSVILAISAVSGYLAGVRRGDGKSIMQIEREAGDFYPFYAKKINFSDQYDVIRTFIYVVTGGAIPAAVYSWRRFPADRKRNILLRIIPVALFSIIIFVAVFWQTFESFEQSGQYYSEAMDYGVYDQEAQEDKHPLEVQFG